MTVLSKQLTPLDKAEIARGLHEDCMPKERVYSCGIKIYNTLHMISRWRKQNYDNGNHKKWDEWYDRANINDWLFCWNKYSFTSMACGHSLKNKKPIDDSYYEEMREEGKPIII